MTNYSIWQKISMIIFLRDFNEYRTKIFKKMFRDTC